MPYLAEGIVIFQKTVKGPAPKDSAASFNLASTADSVKIRHCFFEGEI
jgi:hypothetical protein